MVNAVRGLLASVHFICQYPDCKSRLVKMVAPSKQSRESSILGKLCIFNGSVVKHSQVYTKSHTTILLTNQYHWTSPGASRPMYGSYIQHFLEMFLNFFLLMWRYPTIPFLEWGHIIQFDIMLNQRSFA